jgi:hypothetical protein
MDVSEELTLYGALTPPEISPNKKHRATRSTLRPWLPACGIDFRAAREGLRLVRHNSAVAQPLRKSVPQPKLVPPDSYRRWQLATLDQAPNRLWADTQVCREVALIDLVVHSLLQVSIDDPGYSDSVLWTPRGLTGVVWTKFRTSTAVPSFPGRPRTSPCFRKTP